MRTIHQRVSTRDTVGADRAAHRDAGVRFSSHLNSSDALLWNIEQDPSLRTTIVAISLLDRSPDWDRVVERVTDAVAAVPRLRQRVVAAPLRIGLPWWQAADVDISDHLRRVVARAGAHARHHAHHGRRSVDRGDVCRARAPLGREGSPLLTQDQLDAAAAYGEPRERRSSHPAFTDRIVHP